MDVIWMRPERAARGPKRAHSREEIAHVCVHVADAEGLGAVSMRRVASELGTGTTSLYRYVASKEDLFDLMVDLVLGSAPLPEPTGYWPTDLRQLASWQRARLLRHPWMTELSGRPAMGPHGLAVEERGLRTLDGWGLSIDEIVILVEALNAYVHGHAVRELSDRAATRRSGQDREAWMDAHAAYARTVIESGRFPMVTRAWLDAELPHAQDRADRSFEHGLDRLLAGFGLSIRASREP